ncbi:MAG: gliding motility-associated C-terminal domain-containing protein, partial [Mariniphaga sp.]|nr:gliding motility-associated C-terminal domain-containing protein [Mariniphaga sp.]
FDINILIDASRNPIFPGDSITFFATVEDHGANPVYEWRVNNEVVQSGPDSIYFTSSIYADAVITCSLISHESCADPNPALSNEYYVKVESPVVFFPNSFKPSSTRGNNIFKAVTSLTYIPSYNLTIYNRWGQKIFSTNNVTEGWDGKINGEFAPAGVYVWVVNYSYSKDLNSGGTEIKDKGTVTLIE